METADTRPESTDSTELKLVNLSQCQDSIHSYANGDNLFVEGDECADLYILVEGRLDVLKGNKRLTTLTNPGTMVGEISYLLGSPRSATLRANGQARVIKIPAEGVDEFLEKNPAMAPEISRSLAGRLQETTKVVHGLNEFIDQVPEALVMIDDQQKINAWNKAAENLFGYSQEAMSERRLDSIFYDPGEFHTFYDEIQNQRTLAARQMCINHPQDGRRHISLSTTTLYDGHHNISGFLFLARDFTEVKSLEDRYNRLKHKWFMPAALAVAAIALAVIFIVPKLSTGNQILAHKEKSFQSRLIEDHQGLAQAIATASDATAMETVLAAYMKANNPDAFAIRGIALLDHDKKVYSAVSTTWQASALRGMTYNNLISEETSGDDTTLVSVLSLYRNHPDHPMGLHSVEVAFKLSNHPKAAWLIFMLDKTKLKQEFGLNAKRLSSLAFDS